MKNMVKRYWFVGSVFFCLLLPLFLGDYRREISENENRTLAKLEKFVVIEDGMLTITKNPFTMFGNWFGDHVGFREQSVRVVGKLKYDVFHVLDNDQILVGKEGHWFYAGENRINLENYQRTNSADLETCNKVFDEFDKKLQKKGIEFLMLLCCNKESVYPEFMPDNIKVVGDKSKMDSIYEYLAEHSEFEIISMKESLLSHKYEGKLLYNKKHDVSHWNNIGAYFGYYELLMCIKKIDPTINVIMPDEIKFEKEKVTGDYLFGGVQYEDEKYNWNYSASDKVEILNDQDKINAFDTSIYYHYLNKELNVKGKTILIAGDSYTYSFLLPLISQSFENTYFIHVASEHLKDYIDIIKPNYFVYETVERSGVAYPIFQQVLNAGI